MMGRLVTLAAIGVGLTAGLSGCGTGAEVTADTSCDDYLERPRVERDDVTERLSSELGDTFVAAPMIRVAVDYYCTDRGDTKIHTYFDRRHSKDEE